MSFSDGILSRMYTLSGWYSLFVRFFRSSDQQKEIWCILFLCLDMLRVFFASLYIILHT